MNNLLSIVTPTYNRGELLKDCYDSLVNQTRKNFEWIIVDDGSTDNTEAIVKSFIQEKTDFEIKYIKKQNGGKHTALNRSHQFITGEYVLMLDSDDKLTYDAVETVYKYWDEYRNNEEIGLLIFLKENENKTACAYAKDELIPVNLLKYKRTKVISSDCCEVIRTELFLKYPFPIFANEKFLAETALWYRVGLEKKCVYVNKAIYVCEYLDGGLSDQGRAMRLRNPKGGAYTSYLRMHRKCNFNGRIKASLLYIVYCLFDNKNVYEIINGAKPYFILVSICMLPGFIIYLLWRSKYKSA